jgi:hypothetical protein
MSPIRSDSSDASRVKSRTGRFATVALAALVTVLTFSTAAGAAVPELLGQVPDDGMAGAGAGEVRSPTGLAVDSSNGHLYAVERDNHRVSEFTAWGEFVRAFGWGVADGSSELQVCTTTCRAGIAGSQPGQFEVPTHVEVDSAGNVYVSDGENRRIQKFAPDGEFLLMFGGEVNKTTGADVCTATEVAGGQECGAGVRGTAPGQFDWFWREGDLAIGADAEIYVSDTDRIQVFDLDGQLLEIIDFSEVPGLPDGEVRALALDPEGLLYIALRQAIGFAATHPYVYKVDPASRMLLKQLPVEFPHALATDSAGNLYVVAEYREPKRMMVLQFDSNGDCIICLDEGFAQVEDNYESEPRGVAIGEACGGSTQIYLGDVATGFSGPRSFISIYGAAPDAVLCPPPARPPTIVSQYATSVGSESALLGAGINPRYWPDATYQLEYGTEDCAISVCQTAPLSPRQLTAKTLNTPVQAPVQLEGLEPGTTYHYRFIATSSGGGPTLGPDRTFRTRALPEAANGPDTCPNAAFRFGAAASLPDCRAYELVSPLQKNGANVINLGMVTGFTAALNQSAEAGGKLTYSSASTFGSAQSSPYVTQYIAERGTGGWSTRSISPPRNGPILERAYTTDTQFKAFSPDLCLSWLRHDSDPPLAEGAPTGYANLYRRDQCAQGPYRALRTPPPTLPPANYQPDLQGFSADGINTIFAVNDALTPDAPVSAGYKLYESVGEEEVRFVCILPNGQPVKTGCTAGTESERVPGYSSSVHNAISEDGSRIFWSVGGSGRLYARVGGVETIPVSTAAEARSGKTKVQFHTATPSGSEVLFEVGDNLYTFDLETGETTEIAKRTSGVLGSSEDLSRVYFVSREALAAGGTEGGFNLYLYAAGEEEGEADYRFVAPLSAADTDTGAIGGIPTPVNFTPSSRVSRTSPDGGVLAFASTGSPTGYDNADRDGGRPAFEVYRYNADSDQLHCVSCDPTGARPAARELIRLGNPTGTWASALIPAWQNQLYASRALSEDGSRLFFESYQQLALGDHDETLDVYQWQAPGSGSCVEGKGDYSEPAGGCVSLLTAGAEESSFLDASADGREVFIATTSKLLPQDYGLRDVYVVRVGGGFPQPAPAARECEGAACQSPAPPPAALVPPSATITGPGNPKAARCPKGKRPKRKGQRPKHKSGRIVCVKKKTKKHRKGRKTRGHDQRRSLR